MRGDTTVSTRVYATIDGTEYLIFDDAGRRDIISFLHPGFTAVSVLLSRRGNMAILEVTDFKDPAEDFITLPVGFRTRGWTRF